MKFGSVCSGIDAASVAWTGHHGGPMNWSPVFFSEIEDWPCAALAHHYGANLPDENYAKNGTPNYGDMNNFKMWPDHSQESDDPIDVLIGGTPCQSFSIAGLRGGLDDPRGNLALTYIALVDRYRPRWIVWENVPGVLSSWSDVEDSVKLGGDRRGQRTCDQTNDFDTFIAGLTEIGYHCAWRVLDAQFIRVDGMERAVPQRRRRIFVVGHFRDWRCAAAVLLDQDSLRRNPAPRRQAGQGAAADVGKGAQRRGNIGSHWDGSGVHPSLNQSSNTGGIGASNQEVFSQHGSGLVAGISAHDMLAIGEYGEGDTASTVKARDYKDATDLVAFNARQDPEVTGGRAGPLDSTSPQAQAVAFKSSHYTRDKDGAPSDVVPPLSADADKGDQDTLVCAPVAIQDGRSISKNQNGLGVSDEGASYTVDTSGAQAVAFAQNTRDEVRLVGGDGSVVGALAAEPGMKQTSYVAEPITIMERGRAGGANLEHRQDGTANAILTPNGGRGGMGVGAIATKTVATAINRDITPKTQDELAFTLTTPSPSGGGNPQAVFVQAKNDEPLAFKMRGGCEGGGKGYLGSEKAFTLSTTHDQNVFVNYAVRRLTPTECERLQAFPDGYTQIPWRGKDISPDGRRYKALGNSMAVNVIRWLGQRIEAVDKIDREVNGDGESR